MSYDVKYLDSAEDGFNRLPPVVAEALCHRINLYLCEDVVGRSVRSNAPFPRGRIFSYDHLFKGKVYKIKVLFVIGQGPHGDEVVRVAHIYSETEDA